MAILANLSRRTRILGGGVLLLIVGAFAARAGIASLDQRGQPPAPPTAAAGYEADDHFPGAAQLLLDAPVRRGETGTAPLPALPAHADAGDPGDASIRPARPFVLRGTQLDRARALQCLTTAIYYEAGNEPEDGQRAVAQVVLNRVRHPAFPASVCGVVFQGSDRPVCQFSFACDGAMARVPVPSVWLRSRRVAARALAGEVFAPVGLATHYHTYAVTPSWNRALVMTGVFGAHFFHRWKGWWGTPAAFTDRHTGVEPPPGPLRPLPPPPAVEPVVVETAPMVPPAFVAPPAPVASATPRPEEGTRLPPESQILDRWKDSGKPLR
ncbi:cell wall hydrolase [Sphingomonas hankookensis]|uniref:Cell wall hydrolase n=1 Tax=Sphingomonas hengshuiensis TaxID=1609977 RepID=A0A2W4Z6V6_9SPHN|nr:MAG: cell wall hydrolase [Sphingomonas hengshuiensis]